MHVVWDCATAAARTPATTCCCASSTAMRLWRWPTCCPRRPGWTSWTATCSRLWATRSLTCTRRAWACPCCAGASRAPLCSRCLASPARRPGACPHYVNQWLVFTTTLSSVLIPCMPPVWHAPNDMRPCCNDYLATAIDAPRGCPVKSTERTQQPLRCERRGCPTRRQRRTRWRTWRSCWPGRCSATRRSEPSAAAPSRPTTSACAWSMWGPLNTLPPSACACLTARVQQGVCLRSDCVHTWTHAQLFGPG